MEIEKGLGIPWLRRKPMSTGVGSSVSPGLYHFPRSDTDVKTRLHLRVDPDGCGTLVINASSIIHFNATAAQIAYYHLGGKSAAEISHTLQKHYDLSADAADKDVELITADIEAFINSNGKPVDTFSGIEISAPYSMRPTAPYRMDLAITYRCNNDCPHCYNARLRSYPELETDDWKRIIDQLWELRVPHLIFTGGEPTLRDDLPELIRYAEDKGQITGLNTNGRRLSDHNYVKELVNAGLDHIQITLESHDPEIHDRMVNQNGAWKQTVSGIENALESSLFVMTNTTMLKDNYQTMDSTLDFLIDLGMPTIGLNALIYSGRGADVGTGLTEKELTPLLAMAQQKTGQTGTRLIWYTPTLYCHFNPLEMGLGIKGCTAALYNMCVEPDGGVIPCQSYYTQLGNLLQDPWQAIWEHDLAINLRERQYIPEDCKVCSLLEDCGSGCPLAYTAQRSEVYPVIPPPN